MKKKLLLGAAIIFFPIGIPLIAYNRFKKRRRKNKAPAGRMPVSASMSTSPVVPFVKSRRIGDLGDKLWGGFSNDALVALEKVVASSAFGKRHDYEGALEVLAGWHAAHFDWDVAADLVLRIPRRSLTPRAIVLAIEALIRAGRYTDAEREIEEARGSVSAENLLLALSNLIHFRNDVSPHAERLEILNRVFSLSKLAEVSLVDPGKGFVFGNLCCKSVRHVEDGPTVSVLMPVHNVEETLQIAVSSILNQTWRNLEVVIFDDGSTDGTWDVIRTIAASDSRVKCFRNDENIGAYPTRNRALASSTGEFVTVHDGDDWSHPEMIERQLKPLLKGGNVRATISSAVRVPADLTFSLRPHRPNLEYVHRAYPSFLCHKSDVLELGEWDSVTCSADDELIQRFRIRWGNKSLYDVDPQVPMTLQLIHARSLTQSRETSLDSLSFGVRREYLRQSTYWREKQPSAGVLAFHRTSLKHPFPIPQSMAPKNWPRNNHYDLIIISDLGLLGGTRRCNEGYINAALAMGWRVGIFHWPYFSFSLKPVADVYMQFSSNDNVEILVREDVVRCRLLVIHHPPIMSFELDGVPTITADKIAMLVNQCPMQLKSEEPNLYDMEKVDERCSRLFGSRPEWVSISQRTRDVLTSVNDDVLHYPEIWHPPFNGELPAECPQKSVKPGSTVLGRHSRDHWTKWPEGATQIRKAYFADNASVDVRILGGAKVALDILGNVPSNWRVLEFDSIAVTDFLAELDFFVNFVHSDYIEEFGRNIMEAMAAGVVVIMSEDFKSVFGDAAVYCTPDEVAMIVENYSADPILYRTQAQKGFEYVRVNCARPRVMQNLETILTFDRLGMHPSRKAELISND